MTSGSWPPARTVALAGAACAVVAVLRPRYLQWGASNEEVAMTLPGDELVPNADLTATRAITVHTRPDDVWPWIAQLGQGRGGFYSYDFLENLAGCNIHSADRIVPEWQSIDIGATVNLHPEAGLSVVVVEPRRVVVLRGGVQMGKTPAPYDFTWAFVLHDQPDGTTRLVVRERYRYARRWATLLVEPTELISFVMTQRLLRGLRDRAEQAAETRHPATAGMDATLPRTTTLAAGHRQLMTTTFDPTTQFTHDALTGLDEPVRRYFNHALREHAPLTANVRLTMVGRIKVGPVWLAFNAEQVFEGHEFVWRARAGWGPFRPLHVVDQYRAAAGSMDGRIFGRLSFLHAADENTTRASAARGAVESIWVPSSLLPERGVTWRAEQQNVIVATFEVAPERPKVRLTIDDAGAVLSVSVMRWGNTDREDYGYIPFGGNVSADRRFGDFVLPSTVSVGWWFGTDRFMPFFEAKIVTAVPISPREGVD